MGKDFREQLGKAAQNLGMETNKPEETPETANPKPETSSEINPGDLVSIKVGSKLIGKYRNPDGSLYQTGVGEVVRMGYKDDAAGFIVKSRFTDSIYGPVAEIEPVINSYSKDKGQTYLIATEALQKTKPKNFSI